MARVVRKHLLKIKFVISVVFDRSNSALAKSLEVALGRKSDIIEDVTDPAKVRWINYYKAKSAARKAYERIDHLKAIYSFDLVMDQENGIGETVTVQTAESA